MAVLAPMLFEKILCVCSTVKSINALLFKYQMHISYNKDTTPNEFGRFRI